MIMANSLPNDDGQAQFLRITIDLFHFVSVWIYVQ